MGVTKSPEEKRTARLTAVMTEDVKRDFFAYCKDAGFTPSETIRDFIVGRVKKYREKHA